MKLSAPVYLLKRQARALSRKARIPLHEALNRIAAREGFKGWSLLASQASAVGAAGRALLAELTPGDLMLLGSRPGHGKTLLSLELAIEAMKDGRRALFFTLEYNETDILECFATIGEDPATFQERFYFDNSDNISASHIMDRLQSATRGTVVVVDYLQLLDQKRSNPELRDQVKVLKRFAHERGLIIVFISQIDRRYDAAAHVWPQLADVRLPNPLDLRLFNKACFLNNGAMRMAAVE